MASSFSQADQFNVKFRCSSQAPDWYIIENSSRFAPLSTPGKLWIMPDLAHLSPRPYTIKEGWSLEGV